MMQPVKAPWIRPGVVIHDEAAPVDGMLADFAQTLRQRGFAVGGLVQCDDRGRAGFRDLGSGETVSLDPAAADAPALALASRALRSAMRDDADLVVIGRYAAFEHAARELKAAVERGMSPGLPVLTAIPAPELPRWHGFVGAEGAMLAPSLDSLWRWWGPDRLYRDLALGVAEQAVRRVVCGRRWVMVEGPHGSGLAYLPKNPSSLLSKLAKLRRQSLSQLAELCQSWDSLEMAVGIAAINAHYNRADLEGAAAGDGTGEFRGEGGRVVVIGSFPGQHELFPQAQVIDADPQPGEYPIVAIDTLVPGCAAAVVTSSTLVNRNLPRILRLTPGARVALTGPATPLTPRLHDYGVEILGGLVVRDPGGLASAIEAGASPREFTRFGSYVHLRRRAADAGRRESMPSPPDSRFQPTEARREARVAGASR